MKYIIRAIISCGHPKILLAEVVLWAFLFATNRVGWTCGWNAAQKQKHAETTIASKPPVDSTNVQWHPDLSEFSRGAFTMLHAVAAAEEKRLIAEKRKN